jgi:hypothetical protein
VRDRKWITSNRSAAHAAVTSKPATLFFIHERSHQEFAVFLGLPVATVNNRLHAARSKLKERMLVMVNETFPLPDDFANRIAVQSGRPTRCSGASRLGQKRP